jgi:uncharacterized protein
MEILRSKFYEKLATIQTDLVRDYIQKIDWNNRFIGIKGSRGVGKTTLLLQYIKLHHEPDHRVLYMSLDDLYFTDNKLYDLADEFYKKGGELLALDEVHRYPNWATEIKNIYDDMPDLKLIFTGSSLLHLRQAKADLSRRAVMYSMPGLSFREFILFETGHQFDIISLQEIIDSHINLTINIKGKIKPLALFQDYLHHGYFPFYRDNLPSFHLKLNEILLTILEIDIPQFANIPTKNIIFLKKLLKIISHSVPFKPNFTSLSDRTGISINTIKSYLQLLVDAEILNLLIVNGKGLSGITKPEKIYLNNCNLMHNLSNEKPDVGNIRETFFLNQTSNLYDVYASKVADFEILDYQFEIGGKNKKRKQIRNVDNAYLVKDDMEFGSENNLPLWLFGFLY